MENYGVIFDVETTGLDCEKDEIIEISYLTFLLHPTPRMKQAHSFLAQSLRPLADEIKLLTGLDDQVIRGESIPWDQIRDVFSGAQVIIAHNAGFDLRFLKKYLPDIQGNFACSLKHIDWESKNKKSRDLISLAAHHGFLNPFPHRALFDTATLFRIVSEYLPEILTRSKYRYYKVTAQGAPFDKKDLLKDRRYKWDPEKRVWWCLRDETLVEQEERFLNEYVYAGIRGQNAHIVEVDLLEEHNLT